MSDQSLHIDYEWLDIVSKELLTAIRHTLQQHTDEVSFDDGYLGSEEGYKYRLYEQGRDKLGFELWSKSDIGTGKIFQAVMNSFRPGMSNNLMYFTTDRFEKKALSDMNRAESILFDVYRGNDDQTAFNELTGFFGKVYDRTAYMYFLKDREKYLPIVPNEFRKRFKWLRVYTDCFDKCTWDNYNKIIDAIRDVKEHIQYLFSESLSLLDAHSFIWCMSLLNEKLENSDIDFRDYADGKISLTKEQWKEILTDQELISEEELVLLGHFYISPDHSSTLKRLGERLERDSSSFISPVVGIGKRIRKRYNLPEIIQEERQKYWVVLFLGRRHIDGLFEWKMRPELEEAFSEICHDEIGKARYEADVAKAVIISDDEVWNIAKERSKKQKESRAVNTKQYIRDPYVSEVAKRRAKGICLLCGEEAPFSDKKGNPYLEVHHVVWLSRGGEDSIANVAALCPNCHRKMHIVDSDVDVEFLKSCIEDYMMRENN